jgi:hypothetical protein
MKTIDQPGVKMNLEDCVKEFCKVFRMRKEGKLPPVDLRVSCQVCGHQIMEGETIDYTEKGIVCKKCVKSEVLGEKK